MLHYCKDQLINIHFLLQILLIFFQDKDELYHYYILLFAEHF
nr:MAG TPA: hypothetical protein [Caudoviricetes sp.]